MGAKARIRRGSSVPLNHLPVSYQRSLIVVIGLVVTLLPFAGRPRPVAASIDPDLFREVAGAPTTSGVYSNVFKPPNINKKSWGAAWGNFNGDQFPDLWLNHHGVSRPSLYINNGQVTNGPQFTDIAARSGACVSPLGVGLDPHGAAWADFDGDGWQDLVQLTDEGGADSPQWLLQNSTRTNASCSSSRRFVDRARALGLDVPLKRGRTPLWLDQNVDGKLDLLVPVLVRHEEGPLPVETALFRQKEDGSFEDVTSAVFPDELANSNHFAQLADVVGDARLELLLQEERLVESGWRSVYPDHVFEDTDGTLTALAQPPEMVPALDAVVADFNGDARTDLFTVGGEHSNDLRMFLSPNRISARLVPLSASGYPGFSYRAGGPTSTIKIAPGYLLDGLGEDPERIFVGSKMSPVFFDAPMGKPNVVSETWTFLVDSRNVRYVGTPAFTKGEGVYVWFDRPSGRWNVSYRAGKGDLAFEVTSTNGVSAPQAVGFPTHQEPTPNRLMLRTDEGFEDATEASGLESDSTGVNVVGADFDNDMDVDLYIENTDSAGNLPNTLLENDGAGKFTPVAQQGGAVGTNLGRGCSVTTVDYDVDGFMDLFVTNGRKPAFSQVLKGGPYQLFQNSGTLGIDNHWIELDLVGTTSTRDAIGAKVFVTTLDGTTQVREQNGGMHERGGQNHQRLHFGLGANAQISEIRIEWPSGISQSVPLLTDVDRVLTITEKG